MKLYGKTTCVYSIPLAIKAIEVVPKKTKAITVQPGAHKISDNLFTKSQKTGKTLGSLNTLNDF